MVCLALPAAAVLAWGLVIYRPGDAVTWRNYMRLGTGMDWPEYATHNLNTALQVFVELLPFWLVLPFVPWPWRPHAPANGGPMIVEPLLLYSGLCTIALLLWPGANARYAMPIAPALAVVAAIGWDRLQKSSYGRLRLVAGGVVAIGLVYQIVLVTLVMPIFSERFGASRLAGTAIDAAIAADPAPAYCTGLDTNQLFYLHMPIRCVGAADMKALALPAWLVTARASLDAFVALRPDAKVGATVQTQSGPELVGVRLESR